MPDSSTTRAAELPEPPAGAEAPRVDRMAAEAKKLSKLLEATVREQGLGAAEQQLRERESRLWTKLAELAEPLDVERALAYAERAFELRPSLAAARAVSRHADTLGRLGRSERVLRYLIAKSAKTTYRRRTLRLKRQRARVNGWLRLLANGFPLPPRATSPTFQPMPRKVMYCLHNSFPHDTGGYATRSHGVVQGVERGGTEMVAYTRWGYPWDMIKESPDNDPASIAEEDLIDGVVYHRLKTRTEGRDRLPMDRYIARYAEELERVARQERPCVMHAASAFLVGLAAVTAARRLGIPSVYEVRGLWEIARVSRTPLWLGSEEYQAFVRLETEAALGADAVLTLTGALKRELVRRGVPAEKITIVPNSVDPDRFAPAPRDPELVRRHNLDDVCVVGYIGSFVDYEGLDDLLHAVAFVHDRGTDLRLLLVGGGAETPRLERLVRDLELTEQVIMPGRVPFAEVQRYYTLVDVAVFPRKPWPVTEMVSPMKPFEAMAMEKAVLVSSVEALAEIVTDGETGRIFEKGNLDSLIDALDELARDASLRRRLGENARRWVVENRSWAKAAATINDVYFKVQQHRELPALKPTESADTKLWERLHNPREQERQRAILTYPWSGRVLDIGIGHGYVACQIARVHAPEQIVGIDVGAATIKHALLLAAANGIDSITGVSASGEQIPFADQSFDRVLISQVLEHIHEPDLVLREIARVLRPTGTALITVPSHGKMPPGTVAGHVQDFSVEDLRRRMAEAGLETIEHRTVGVREFHFVRPKAPLAVQSPR